MSANKSAAKRVRTGEKARLRHKSRRTALKTSEKKFNVFVESAELDKAKEQLKDVFKQLDKAVKTGTIHKNKRNRKKSRLCTVLSKAV
jgi:small subunit ribosomal protein S20